MSSTSNHMIPEESGKFGTVQGQEFHKDKYLVIIIMSSQRNEKSRRKATSN